MALMKTKSGGAGAFAAFDLNRVSSPAFVIDEAAVENNLMVLSDIAEQSGAKILLALKAFSMWSLAPLVSKYLSGTCASGLYEARLGREFYQGEVSTYCAGYKAQDLPEIFKLSDHVLFNSLDQKTRFWPLVEEARKAGEVFDIGLRINPELAQGEIEKYDPCQPFSRLGTPISALCSEDLNGIEGLHFHTLCEQDVVPLRSVWQRIKPFVMAHKDQLKWLNVGGGHHITRADYQRDELISLLREIASETGLQIYLEPGEAVALDTGILIGEILDVMENEMPVAILDISATCHMPDVIEAPYRPDMLGEAGDIKIRLGGPSCLAGDIIGDYHFSNRPKPGTRIAFLDQAHYSMVKTNTFNGVPLPSIYAWDSRTDALRLVKEFGYDNFKNRLS